MQWRRYLWGIEAHAPSRFGNSVRSAAAAIKFNCKAFESCQRKTRRLLNVHLSSQKHAKAHVNGIKQSWNPKEIPGRGEEEKFMLCPLTSFPCDATVFMHTYMCTNTIAFSIGKKVQERIITLVLHIDVKYILISKVWK